jgi:hypothetical protein
MTRRRLAVVLVAALAFIWWRASRSDTSAPVAATGPAPRTADDPLFQQQLAQGRDAIRRMPRGLHIPQAPDDDGNIAVSGTVIDAQTRAPVGGVEVVYRSPLGETSVTSNVDGTYRISVVPGVYRAFVRDDHVLSVGAPDHQRLPGPPSPDAAGVPDESLIPLVTAKTDTAGVDLAVLEAGDVSGRVLDSKGRPVANVVLKANGALPWRPVLGTDIVESDAAGNYAMTLPAGDYQVDAFHPAFAGKDPNTAALVSITSGGHTQQDITLAAGCIITGKVVGADGKAAGDGAIERKWGDNDTDFGPAGQISADGTFRWVTTEEQDITIRAWPWKSPPSPARTFACKDGARFTDVAFMLPNQGPDLSGVLVDREGNPVPFAFIDLAPLDNGINQQERTDAQGRWGVYSMPAGRYTVTGYAPERGVVATVLTAPIHDARLQLGGTGALEGTTAAIANGSFQLQLSGCDLPAGSINLPHEPQLVSITDGHFRVDGLPACNLTYSAKWQNTELDAQAEVPPDGAVAVELEVGPPHAKTVHGVVSDGSGRPIAGAAVSAYVSATASGDTDEKIVNATTDANGAYTLKSWSGAQLVVSGGGSWGRGTVGRTNVDDERVDITVSPRGEDDDVLN